MATKYALHTIADGDPSLVSGFCHWLTFNLSEDPDSIVVLTKYWENAVTEIGRHLVRVTKELITHHGGEPANWMVICTKAENSSDTDDVVEYLSAEDWGQKLLWSNWRHIQSNM